MHGYKAGFGLVHLVYLLNHWSWAHERTNLNTRSIEEDHWDDLVNIFHVHKVP